MALPRGWRGAGSPGLPPTVVRWGASTQMRRMVAARRSVRRSGRGGPVAGGCETAATSAVPWRRASVARWHGPIGGRSGVSNAAGKPRSQPSAWCAQPEHPGVVTAAPPRLLGCCRAAQAFLQQRHSPSVVGPASSALACSCVPQLRSSATRPAQQTSLHTSSNRGNPSPTISNANSTRLVQRRKRWVRWDRRNMRSGGIGRASVGTDAGRVNPAPCAANAGGPCRGHRSRSCAVATLPASGRAG